MWDFPLFPEQASTAAPTVDRLFFALTGLSLVFVVGIVGAILYFSVKYRRGSDADRSNPSTGSLSVELTWTIIPLFLGTGMFVWASAAFFKMQTPPPGQALEIYVTAKQWMWKTQHPNGAREINALHIPVGRPVKLIMTSQDVIHSFYVPAFRIKHDVLPGRYYTQWFQATKPGRYHLFCTEYCGTDHSRMGGWVYAMEPADYEQWLQNGATGGSNTQPGTGRYQRAPTGAATRALTDAGATRAPSETEDASAAAAGAGPPGATPPPQDQDAPALTRPSMAAAGAELFAQLRCNSCHRVDSTALYPAIGPVLQGVYGHPVELQNNRSFIADEQYLRESILHPQAKLVAGYPAVMPTYQGQIGEEELMQLVAYIKSLSADSARARTRLPTNSQSREAQQPYSRDSM